MDRKRVVIIKSDFIEEDSRLYKEVNSLRRAGYLVTLLRWDRECKAPYVEQLDETQFRVKAPYGIKILLFLPLWWLFVFLSLIRTHADIIHAINFDSVVPALIAGKFRRKPIIYEMFDTYEDMIMMPSFVRTICVQIDKLFMRLANAVIIADEARVEEFKGIPNKNVAVIYNSFPDSMKGSQAHHQGKPCQKFIIFHAAVFNKERASSIDKAIEAIADIDDVKLILAGFGNEVPDIEKWVGKVPGKAQFIGRISHAEVMQRTSESDLLLSLYNPIGLNMKYTTPNKLFQAMMFAKPILSSKGNETGAKVQRENCGLIVDCNSVEEIREAIIKLRDNPDLCRQLGANGRRAYEQRYNWGIMEQRLLTLYRGLYGKVIEQKSTSNK